MTPLMAGAKLLEAMMGGGHGIGVKRADYHRRNRRRNISMHSHSRGINVGASYLEQIANLQITIPYFRRSELIERAGARPTPHSPIEAVCVNYLRHEYGYKGLLNSRKKVEHDVWLLISKKIFDAIAEVYPWLADECEAQYAERSSGVFRAANGVRVVKRYNQLTSEQVEEFNVLNTATVQSINDDEQDEKVSLDGALTSLASERLLFFPPFLKPDEIRRRRFGDEMNDNWWEWEQELQISTLEGRPHEHAK